MDETTIAARRAEVTAAQQGQARAGAEREQAEQALAVVRQALADEFGVTDAGQIPARLTELDAEADAENERVRALLARSGGGQ